MNEDWFAPIKEFLLPSVYASPAVADAAEKYIGQGEQGGNNRGAFIKKIGGQQGRPWCSAFASKCVTDAGENPFGFLPMARQWLNKGREAGMEVKKPQRGDLAVFSRGDPKGSQGHIGIVSKIGKDKIVMIEGNVGSYPSHVKKVIYDKNKMNRLLGYIRTNEDGHKRLIQNDYVEKYGKREDGTSKGLGYFGELKGGQKNAKISTELSVGVKIGGKETLIPSLVPTLTGEEVAFLVNGGDARKSKAIMDKAIAHARKRIKEGKSPFAQKGEQRDTPDK